MNEVEDWSQVTKGDLEKAEIEATQKRRDADEAENHLEWLRNRFSREL